MAIRPIRPQQIRPMTSCTIQITGGVVGSRLWLKTAMEKFGRVEVVHTGNRQDPTGEPPWVRFGAASAAEKALEAINNGLVLLDGATLTAEFKTGGRAAPPRFAESRQRPLHKMELTSRDLAQEASRRGRGRSRSRSRSRSRRRRH